MAGEQTFHERQVIPRGNWGNMRGDSTGAAVVSPSGVGDYGEAALKGHLFCGISNTNTIAAGNVVGAAAAAVTNTCLLNPTTSTVALVLQKVTLGIDSGTFAAGGIFHSVSRDTTVSTAVVGFTQGKRCNLNSSQDAQGYVLDSNAGVALTGSAVLQELGLFCGTTAAAITTGLLVMLQERIDGAIVLGPGDAYLPTFAAAGTTVIANVGYLWTEVPLLTNS